MRLSVTVASTVFFPVFHVAELPFVNVAPFTLTVITAVSDALVAVTVLDAFSVVTVYDVFSESNVGVKANEPIANPDRLATKGLPLCQGPCNQRWPEVSPRSITRSGYFRAWGGPAEVQR